MNREMYVQAMSHVKFSENLEEKILAHLESQTSESRQKNRKWVPRAAAAAACLVCVLAGILFFTADHDKGAREPLPTISFSFVSEGSGGNEGCGWLVIRDIEDMPQGNPTLNRVDAIKELPVFKNDRELRKDTFLEGKNTTAQFRELKEKMGFVREGYDVLKDYTFDGKTWTKEQAWFEANSGNDMTEDLLNYQFRRIEWLGDNEGWARAYQLPKETVGIYPIITSGEAEKKLRQGKFFTYGTDEEAVAKTAKILSVELVYMKDDYQKYIQPAYKFVITDKSWEQGLAAIMKDSKSKNSDDFLSVSEIFVPALPDRYLEVTEPELQVN